MQIPITEKLPNQLPPADWAGEIERLREEVRTERDKTLRALADFKNYRRNIERDGNKLASQGKREMILPILDILDDIENSMRWTGENDETAAQCVRIIQGKCIALLKLHGVVPFESVGSAFDHNLQEAVAMADNEEVASGIVIDEFQKGYLWNNELLRAAKVRVTA